MLCSLLGELLHVSKFSIASFIVACQDDHELYHLSTMTPICFSLGSAQVKDKCSSLAEARLCSESDEIWNISRLEFGEDLSTGRLRQQLGLVMSNKQFIREVSCKVVLKNCARNARTKFVTMLFHKYFYFAAFTVTKN